MESFGFKNWTGDLDEDQVECKNKILECMHENRYPILTSIMGAGKTAIVTRSAIDYQADVVIVVAPKGAISKWKDSFSITNIKTHFLTYEKLKRCSFLTYLEEEYIATPQWQELVDEKKIVFVVDEFHRLQHMTLQTRAVACLVRKMKGESRMIGISYTPCCVRSDFIHFAYVMRYIDTYDPLLFNEEILTAYIEASFATQEEKEALINRIPLLLSKTGKFAQTSRLEFVANIYAQHIIPYVTFSSTPAYTKEVDLIPDYGNILYKVNDEDASELRSILHSVIEVTGRFVRVKKADKKAKESITQRIEKIKTPIYSTLAKSFLDENPTGKVVIMVLHLQSLVYLEGELRQYGITKLQGEMSSENRDFSIKLFQEDNNDFRVMLSTIFMGESVDLHDQSLLGNRPRLILIPACYYTKCIVQSVGRVYRRGITSRPTVRIVYTAFDGISLEKKYYDSIKTKSTTISSCHARGQKETLPCHYQDIYLQSTF